MTNLHIIASYWKTTNIEAKTDVVSSKAINFGTKGNNTFTSERSIIMASIIKRSSYMCTNLTRNVRTQVLGIQSTRTRKIVYYRWSENIVNHEHEVIADKYVPTTSTENDNPQLQHTTLIIYNT